MSEQETQAPTNPPETAPAASPETQPDTPQGETGSSPFLDMDAKVKIDGEEMTVGDLANAKREAQWAEEYAGHARRILRGDEPPEQTEASVRYIMSVEGYSPEQIDQYVQEQKMETPAEQPQQIPTQQPPAGQGSTDGALQERIRQLEHEQGLNQQRAHKQQVDTMREKMRSTVSGVLDQNKDVRVLLEASRRLQDEDASKRVPAMIGSEIERQILAQLSKRQASGQQFQMSWFDEEASIAAKAVAERYRTVIGDPNRLQRAPETVSGERAILPEKQVAEPEYKGQLPSQVQNDVHEWASDALSRLALETQRGGETRA